MRRVRCSSWPCQRKARADDKPGNASSSDGDGCGRVQFRNGKDRWIVQARSSIHLPRPAPSTNVHDASLLRHGGAPPP